MQWPTARRQEGRSFEGAHLVLAQLCLTCSEIPESCTMDVLSPRTTCKPSLQLHCPLGNTKRQDHGAHHGQTAWTCCWLLNCFGILGRKKGRNLESHYDSVPFTYKLVFLLPPVVYIEAYDSPVRRTKKGRKRDMS